MGLLTGGGCKGVVSGLVLAGGFFTTAPSEKTTWYLEGTQILDGFSVAITIY